MKILRGTICLIGLVIISMKAGVIVSELANRRATTRQEQAEMVALKTKVDRLLELRSQHNRQSAELLEARHGLIVSPGTFLTADDRWLRQVARELEQPRLTADRRRAISLELQRVERETATIIGAP